MKIRMWVTLLLTGAFFFCASSSAQALSFTFSDKDFLSGASWGTMTIEAVDADTLAVTYSAALNTVIPSGAQVTGFGFAYDYSPSAVGNPVDGAFGDDRDDLNWIVLDNLNAIPNPANGDEFIPPITKDFYSFGVTEGNANNINPPGILPGEKDVFYIDFAGITDDLTIISLADFVNVTGIRLQSLPDDINEGSLFLAGKSDGGTPVPEPTTILLLGTGLVGLARFRKKFKK